MFCFVILFNVEHNAKVQSENIDIINKLSFTNMNIMVSEKGEYSIIKWLNCKSSRILTTMLDNIIYKLLENADSVLTQTLLFGNASFNISDNTKILNAAINFVLLAKRFDEPLF